MTVEMSNKRRWLPKIYNSFQKDRSIADISWSNSDSESEAGGGKSPTQKKLKQIENLKDKSKKSAYITPPKNYADISPKLQQCDEFLESPIISEFKWEEQSPVLTQNDIVICREQSPVLNRSNIMRKIRWRYRRKKEIEAKKQIAEEESSDSSLSPSSLRIDTTQTTIIKTPLKIDNLTQCSLIKTQIEISPAKTEISQPYDIVPFPSQHSSEVIDSVTASSSTTSSTSDKLYHQPPPRRKKFKKGGLAYQLQKAVTLQSTRTAIWQHEVFLSKSKGEEEGAVVSEGIKFTVRDKWKEYGCTVLECGSNDVSLKKINSCVENDDTFLLIVGVNNSLNVCFEVGGNYEIFSPYCIKVVNHKSEKTLCFVNGSKFLLV